MPKGGGDSRVLIGNAHDPISVAADGEQVYWSDGFALIRMPRKGGKRALLTVDRCRALALDATHVYCLDDGVDGITRVPKSGGRLEFVVARGGAYETALAVGPAAVYFDGVEEVRRAQPRTECVCCGSQSASCREPDPWIDQVSMLASAPRTGGAPTPLVHATHGRYVVTDGRRAYWATGGRLMSVDLDGGAPREIADAGHDPPEGGLAVDASRLYWVTEKGELRTAPK